MNKRNVSLSVAAVLAASVMALQSPLATAAGNTASSDTSTSQSQSASNQNGVPGVEMNVGSNASDRGLPGVEMNIGRDGDQKNIDTRTLGAGSDDSTVGSDMQSSRPLRVDRN
ncbi:hypothetical protein H8N03_06660 [Ramlibacter sp. USB13]|uniref:Secreted protein n=1 Tax=Ramlibacter cellulosilyticus TaxID=2764187 RepID=A0A923SAB7_9BURK|nr:hypothetical protein [Ramlibacter cellulosilyticus]MBC5782620.1 hypothetical protein [Ramlibacter cellulosilyticus]